MQTATPPIHGAAAVRTSSSAPASSTTAARSLSALDTPQRIPSPHGSTTGIAPDQALRFVANHHRQHNPNDPKLRANPSFKSRRSSLLGSVLKSKSKDDSRKLAKAPVLSRPTAPVALKPRASSATAHHQHTRSLPSADHDRVSQQAPHATVDSSSSRNANVAKQQDSGAPALPAGAHPENPHPLSQQVKARHFHLGDSPPVASFPSPVDSLPEGSASTCSSAMPKASTLPPSLLRPPLHPWMPHFCPPTLDLRMQLRENTVWRLPLQQMLPPSPTRRRLFLTMLLQQPQALRPCTSKAHPLHLRPPFLERSHRKPQPLLCMLRLQLLRHPGIHCPSSREQSRRTTARSTNLTRTSAVGLMWLKIPRLKLLPRYRLLALVLLQCPRTAVHQNSRRMRQSRDSHTRHRPLSPLHSDSRVWVADLLHP